MACTINVDWNKCKGFKYSGVLKEIYVQGTAQGCNVVNVTLTCGYGANEVSLPPVNVVVGPNNVWFNTFTNLPQACHCAGSISILAKCEHGQNECKNEDIPVDLNCEEKIVVPPSCPLPDWSSPNSDCDKSGNRKISLSVTLFAYPGIVWTADLYDPSGTILGSIVGQQGPVTLGPYWAGPYPGGSTQKFDLNIKQPPSCAGIKSHTVTLLPCGEPPPPTGGRCITGSNVVIGECDATGKRQVSVTWSATCFEPMDVDLHDPSGAIVNYKNNSLNPIISYKSLYQGGTNQQFEVEIKKPTIMAGIQTIIAQVSPCVSAGNGGGGGNGGGEVERRSQASADPCCLWREYCSPSAQH